MWQLNYHRLECERGLTIRSTGHNVPVSSNVRLHVLKNLMTHEYFSDRELGSRELSSEEISKVVWNSIVATYHQFIDNCALAGNFPEECPDGRVVCGCNKTQMEDVLKGEIPELPIPVSKSLPQSNTSSYFWDDEEEKKKEDDLPNKYAILDFLEFLHKNIKDPTELGHHSYFNHNHYSFSDEGSFQAQFRERINTIFSRNGIVFFLDENGQIRRSIPKSIAKIITDIRFSTGDQRLNELLEIAYSKFVLPRPESRIESLEKIWDAFERLKTYFDENKKTSANTLIDVISENNTLFSEYISREFTNELTKVGNEFQIRHFERNKVKLESNLHIDYFFYRMSCLIHLCIESLKNSQL